MYKFDHSGGKIPFYRILGVTLYLLRLLWNSPYVALMDCIHTTWDGKFHLLNYNWPLVEEITFKTSYLLDFLELKMEIWDIMPSCWPILGDKLIVAFKFS